MWGTGPLAETFPEPLSALERDLWLDPLRDGMVSALQLAGAVSVQGVTDENGRVAFLGLPAAGVITITPSRSGFRFEPPQLTIPDLANPSAPPFIAFPITDRSPTILACHCKSF